jgi:hypothetical protein
MSDKARRSNAWDDRHLTGALWPVKALVRAFSSISLAVVLLVLVILYGVSASVPVGMLALAPTYILYAIALLATLGLATVGPLLIARMGLAKAPPAARFLGTFLVLAACVCVGVLVWARYLWPQLHYDAGTGRGLRLFAAFVEENKATTLRRLPGMEMSELVYYAWWPLRVILLLFVLNMIVATVRRIEFTFRNIGVLTVHTGIVTLALGSIYYSGLKQEGDTLLLAGPLDPATGVPSVGPAQDVFYDNTRVALYVGAEGGWEQRPLQHVPRYNDYNLGAVTGTTALEVSHRALPWDEEPRRDLSIAVPAGELSKTEPDVSLRVVGYCSYTNTSEPIEDWVQTPTQAGAAPNPLRIVYMHSQIPDKLGRVSDDPVFAFNLAPASPADRVSATEFLSVEYTMGPHAGMTPERWRDLSEQLPKGTQHALVVEVPAAAGQTPFRAVYGATEGAKIAVGNTGFALEVKQLLPEPPFPIITEGYRGSTSSVAVVGVTPPAGRGDPFDRYVYHRFPQISQDMLLKELKPNGMPKRRDADPMIRISLIEADQLHVYIDETGPGGKAPDARTRAIVRLAGGDVALYDQLPADGRIPLGDKVSFRVGERWENARRVERPNPVPREAQQKDAVGTHDNAMLAVEVSGKGKDGPFSQIVWLPFTRYMGVGMDTERTVDLPDGRSIQLAFGRLQHPLPGFKIRLVDFQMLAYDHRGAPRDYQSVIRVVPVRADFELFDHVTKLNNPLRAPFEWDDHKSWFTQIIPKLVSGMNPNQFKFSQAGWDQQGWAQTQEQADQGLVKRPYASYTILGVGNNPGIHLVALGGVLMGLGIPWAFYVKPWLVRREKRKIQVQLAAGTYRKPERAAKSEPERVVVER